MQIVPAIMSGGSGTRLWPLSTAEHPKQFHRILSDQPMIIDTAKRFGGSHEALEFLAPMFIAGQAHGGLLAEALQGAGITPSAVILEPVARNTAAVALVAALGAMERAPGAKVLLAPADHVIREIAAFHDALVRTSEAVEDSIVTFGMAPTGPETGFGYIEHGAALADGVFRIASFKEKPDLETAQAYLDSGGYSWNSGIFFFAPEVLVGEFEALQPELLSAVRAAYDKAKRDGETIELDPEAFAKADAKPVDIAIMEKTGKGVVAPCSIGWADVGSWSEYWRLSDKDADANALEGAVLARDVTNTLVRVEDGVQVSIAGVDNLIVVVTKGKVMILPTDRAQDVKSLIPEE